MTWLSWLILVAIVTAAAAVTGIKAKGTRHVANTKMMGAARAVLVIMAIIVAYAVYRARSGS
ncbi:MAG: hypothetical protein WD227_05285 [Vicinamibacterales bacterium]